MVGCDGERVTVCGISDAGAFDVCDRGAVGGGGSVFVSKVLSHFGCFTLSIFAGVVF